MTTVYGAAQASEELSGASASADLALFALLQGHPGARVLAVAGSATPHVVPIPESLGIGPERVINDPIAYGELFETEDRVVVAKLWGLARTEGVAVGPVRLPEPDDLSNLYMFDLRRDHGVIIVVVTPGDAVADEALIEGARLPALPPRLARVGKDVAAVITWTDPALSQILGWTADELVGRRVIELIHPDDREQGILNWMDMLDTPGVGRPARLRHEHKDGSWVWLEVTNRNRLDDPAHRDIVAEMVDISDQMEALDALHAREQLLRQVTEALPVGLFHMDLTGNILYSNSRLADLTGVPSPTGFTDQLMAVIPDDRPCLEDALAVARSGGEADVEVRMRAVGIGRRHCVFRLRPLRNDTGDVTGLTGCIEDVTLAVHKREALEARATRDPLTGCLNRSAALNVLQELLERREPSGRPHAGGTAVIFMDLDGFKPVNDRFGHAAGDEVLMDVAARIRSSVRSGDVVGRFGGDEFLVVCPGVTTPDQALSVARLVGARAFDRPIEVGGEEVALSASLGVSWSGRNSTDALTLVREADDAMYAAKRGHLCRPVLYDEI